jgi:hypothetical protein
LINLKKNKENIETKKKIENKEKENIENKEK